MSATKIYDVQLPSCCKDIIPLGDCNLDKGLLLAYNQDTFLGVIIYRTVGINSSTGMGGYGIESATDGYRSKILYDQEDEQVSIEEYVEHLRSQEGFKDLKLKYLATTL